MKKYALILSIWLLSLVISLKAQEEKILVIVNSQIYSGLQSEISRYIDDISSDYSVSLFETNNGTAQDLKNFIVSQSDSLVGCIFIGNMPVCWFEIDNDLAAYRPTLFPCDLFFMDLDGSWSDEDHDGNYDSHTNGTGDVAPEIFVGRIDASLFSPYGENQVEDLRKYFNRDHNYWTGAYDLRKTGLTYTDDEWKDYTPINEGMRNLYGVNNYHLINDDRISRDDYLKNRLPNNQYEFIQIAAHSTYQTQGFYQRGQIWSDDILDASPKALGYNLFACEACDYTQDHFIGGAYIFSKSEKSLVVVGSTKVGGMLQFYAFYQLLRENKSVGLAYKEWFDYIAPFDDLEKSWHYGMTILGDPLIKFNSGNDNHGPVVDIGFNQRILWPDSLVEIYATMKDDGLPEGSRLTHSWEKVSGPGEVSFDDKNSLSTSVRLDTLGDFRIKLSASDGEYSSEDFKDIKVSRIKWQGETNQLSGKGMGIKVRDTLAYISTSNGLYIINIVNKANPYVIGSYEFQDPIVDPYFNNLDIDSNYAYVVLSEKGLHIINIADCYNLYEVGTFRTNDTSEKANDVKVIGDYAYVADNVRGLMILDIYDRINPRLLSFCPTDGTADALSIQGDYGYVADGLNGLRIIDISDKSHPKEIGSFKDAVDDHYYNYREDVQILGNYAYVSYHNVDEYCCISIIDISDKSNPFKICQLDRVYKGFYVEGNYLYYFGTGDYDVFGIYDITDKSNPKLIESYKREEIVFQELMNIYKYRRYVYILDNLIGKGVNIFQVSLDNTCPYVFAGEDKRITCNSIISLHGLVSDDNLPDGSSLSYTWEKISGPGTLDIVTPNDITTQVVFSDTGTYVMRLTASDGELTGYDDVRIIFSTTPHPVIHNIDICEGFSVPDLTIQGDSIRWYSDAQLTNLLHSGNKYATGKKFPGSYIYYVTQTIGECESEYSAINLSINPLPAINLGKDTTILQNQVIILGPFNSSNYYSWYDGSTEPYFEISGIEIELGYHNISVIVTDTNNCIYSDTIIINVVKCAIAITISAEACEIYNSPSGKYLWTRSGEYNDTIPNIEGCDSAITVNLTILSLDTSVSQNLGVLTANATGAIYQWIDCDNYNALIEGENQQTFTPSENGNYAVIVSENGCIDTSACFYVNITGNLVNPFKHKITLYPNPNNGSFSIDLGKVYPYVEITITELDGRIIQKENDFNCRIMDLKMSASQGMYIVTITSENERTVILILKN